MFVYIFNQGLGIWSPTSLSSIEWEEERKVALGRGAFWLTAESVTSPTPFSKILSPPVLIWPPSCCLQPLRPHNTCTACCMKSLCCGLKILFWELFKSRASSVTEQKQKQLIQINYHLVTSNFYFNIFFPFTSTTGVLWLFTWSDSSYEIILFISVL